MKEYPDLIILDIPIDCGKLRVVKGIKYFTGLGLKEAKDLFDKMYKEREFPYIIKYNKSPQQWTVSNMDETLDYFDTSGVTYYHNDRKIKSIDALYVLDGLPSIKDIHALLRGDNTISTMINGRSVIINGLDFEKYSYNCNTKNGVLKVGFSEIDNLYINNVPYNKETNYVKR